MGRDHTVEMMETGNGSGKALLVESLLKSPMI